MDSNFYEHKNRGSEPYLESKRKKKEQREPLS